MYPAKYQNFNVPSIPLHFSGWQLGWSFFLNIMLPQIIVVLWRQMVKLYEKARFVLYSMEIQCISLRYSNNYSCLLNDLASAHCLMISSASEVQHLAVSRCLFLTAPTILPTYLITFSSGTADTSSTYHIHFNSSPISRCLSSQY